MSSTRLYGLDVPDELTNLDLKDANPAEIAEAGFKVWMDATEEFRGDDSEEWRLYDAAKIILESVKERVTGTLSTDDMPFLKKEADGYVGNYLTILFNKTDLSKLLIGETKDEIRYVGSSLRPGKVLEIMKGARIWYVGLFAKGGRIVNRGKVWHMCDGALDCSVINYGEIENSFGSNAEGGVFINHGRSGTMGRGASGGIFLNYGIEFAQSPFGDGEKGALYLEYKDRVLFNSPNCRSGIFITKTKVYRVPPEEEGSWRGKMKFGVVYEIGPKGLEKDGYLSGLVDEAEEAGKKCDTDRLRELRPKIDKHVRKNYEGRMA